MKMPIVLSILLMIAPPGLLAGQAPLKPLQNHLGIWVGELETPEQETKQVQLKYEWLLANSYIHGTIHMGKDGGDDKLFPAGTIICGWNGAEQQLYMWTF